MAVNIDQVKKLLGSGLQAETVASAVGCEPSYISQLLGNEIFANEVAVLRSESLMANTARDSTMGEIESSLLNRLKDAVDSGLFYKPRDILHATSVVNRLQRRGASAPTSIHMQQTVVTLNLPAAAASRYTINPKGEVLEVDDQTLVTMPARTLLSSLTKSREGGTDEDKYEQARKFIPGAQEHIDSEL